MGFVLMQGGKPICYHSEVFQGVSSYGESCEEVEKLSNGKGDNNPQKSPVATLLVGPD